MQLAKVFFSQKRSYKENSLKRKTLVVGNLSHPRTSSSHNVQWQVPSRWLLSNTPRTNKALKKRLHQLRGHPHYRCLGSSWDSALWHSDTLEKAPGPCLFSRYTPPSAGQCNWSNPSPRPLQVSHHVQVSTHPTENKNRCRKKKATLNEIGSEHIS